LIWGPTAGRRIDETQQLSLAAPKPLDHLLPLETRHVMVEDRSRELFDGSVQACELKDIATGKLVGSLAQIRLPLRTISAKLEALTEAAGEDLCHRKRVAGSEYAMNSYERGHGQ